MMKMLDAHLCTWGEQCNAFRKWHRIMARRVRVYDNGGQTMDRYSVVILRKLNGKTISDVYGMDDKPLSPNGFNQFSYSNMGALKGGSWMGRRVKVQDLPQDVIRAIEKRI